MTSDYQCPTPKRVNTVNRLSEAMPDLRSDYVPLVLAEDFGNHFFGLSITNVGMFSHECRHDSMQTLTPWQTFVEMSSGSLSFGYVLISAELRHHRL